MDLTLADCRPEVRAFALLMEAKLRANDHKAGWKDCKIDWLAKRVGDETLELSRAATASFKPVWSEKRPKYAWNCEAGYLVRERSDGTPEYASSYAAAKTFQPDNLAARRIASEAADVANFAMMVADVAGALTEVS